MSATLRFVKQAHKPSVTAAPVAAKPVTHAAVGGACSTGMVDSRDEAKITIIQSAYEYLADPPALIALLYRTRTIYDSCPPGVPSSELGRGFAVNEHFNHPNSMKALNVMLRHTYNYFNDFTKKMNFDDYEACSEPRNAIYFRARHVRNTIASVFATLSDTSSGTKYKAAQTMFTKIKDYITCMPLTPAERERDLERMREVERRAAAAAAEEAARQAEARERAEKARADAFAAAHGGVRPEDCW
jgi:hypothetical protein